jgi:hypothetical protein
MALLKLVFYGGLAFFGAVSLYIGIVFFLTTGFDGPISIGYPEGGRMVQETVTRAADPSRHFRLQLAMGYAPLVLGALSLFVGVRWFRT